MPQFYNFPDIGISKQLFHVPGASQEGGFTVGGARITSPEPGGRSVLMLTIAMRTDEWNNPLASWLMSKTNGQVLRIQLAMTPQIITTLNMKIPAFDTGQPGGDLYTQPRVKSELRGRYISAALEGSTSVAIDMSPFGPILKPGHLIGHMNNCYLVDDISYDNTGRATLTVTPPFRNAVTVGDTVYFRPYFLGTISNADTFRVTYDAENAGNIQTGDLIFNESVI